MNHDQLVHQLKEIIAEIPFGHVATVEEMTLALELSPEQEDTVAWAAKEIDDDTVPTWRVVRDDGALLYTGTSEINQRELLAREKVSFTESGNVNIQDHFWSACEYIKEAEEI